MQRRTLLSALAPGVALGCLGLTAAPARAQTLGDKIVLGQSAAFSGPSAELGQQYHLGAKLYFDRLNASGGIDGRKIELRKLDDGYEPERCAANTKQFISDGVFALFGYAGTPTTAAALPLATEAKLPLFAPLTGAQSLRDPYNRQIVHVRASYADETAAIVKQTVSMGIKRVAVFHQNDGYGQAGFEGTSRALATHKLEPVAVGTVERNSTDVATALAAILPKNPEAIVQVGTYKACAVFVRLARKAGFMGTFYNVSFVGTQALADELGKDGAGVVVSQVVPSPYQPSRQITREFLDAIKKGGDKVQANYSSLEGYLAARVFTEGLRPALAGGKLSQDSFIAGMESLGSQVISGFPVSFRSSDHTASSFVEMSMLTGDGRVRT